MSSTEFHSEPIRPNGVTASSGGNFPSSTFSLTDGEDKKNTTKWSSNDLARCSTECMEFQAKGLLPQALESAERALEIASHLYVAQDLKVASYHGLLASVLTLMSKHALSINHLEEALRIHRSMSSTDSLDVANILTAIGENERCLDDHARALSFFSEAHKIRHRDSALPSVALAKSLFEMSTEHEKLGNHKEAGRLMVELYRVLLESPKKEHDLALALFINMGDTKVENSSYNEGLMIYRDGLTYFKQLAISNELDPTFKDVILKPLYMRVASTAELLGNYEEAEKTLKELHEYQAGTKEEKDKDDFGPKRSIARILGEKGDLFQSEKLYREILSETEKTETNNDIKAQALIDVAEACLENFKIAEAGEFAKKAHAMFSEISHTKGADVLEVFGNFEMARGNIEEGEELLYKALRTRRSLPPSQENKLEIASLILKMAQIEIHKENFEEALTHIEEAEELFSSVPFLGKKAASSSCIYLRGVIEKKKGNFAEAQELFLKSLETSDPSNIRPKRMGLVSVLLSLGNLALELGNIEEASPYFERAHEIIVARGRETHPLNIHVLQGLKRILESEGESEAAQRIETKISSILTELDYLSDGILFNDPFPPE